MKMEWFGFWIFMAVFVAADHWIFAQGYESFLQRHKTPEEKELQRLKIEELRRRIEPEKVEPLANPIPQPEPMWGR